MGVSSQALDALAAQFRYPGGWTVSQVAVDVWRAEVGGLRVDSTSGEEAFAIALGLRHGTLERVFHSLSRSGHGILRLTPPGRLHSDEGMWQASAMEQRERDAFIDSLIEKGETKVRAILARRGWNTRRTAVAEEWLQSLENTREEQRARQSLSVAKSARTASWLAVAVAVVAIGIALASWLLPR